MAHIDWTMPIDGHGVWPDPDHATPVVQLHEATYPFTGPKSPERVTIDRDTALWLLSVARAYQHLTTHPAGTGACIEDLRAVRRAVRARRAKGTT